MNQYTVPVADVTKSVAFYEALGLKLIVSARNEYALFEVPGDLSTFSLSQSPAQDTVPASGLIYFEVDDVDEAIDTLKNSGIANKMGAVIGMEGARQRFSPCVTWGNCLFI
ncbi:MAG: VOC family protein [Sphingomonadaceae bacterium]|nr:VOC family protein [Sphingomonadaceae bacterium]